MANDSDFYVFGALARLKVEFADEVNLAGGEDHDGNLLQGWDIDWGCTDSSFEFVEINGAYFRRYNSTTVVNGMLHLSIKKAPDFRGFFCYLPRVGIEPTTIPVVSGRLNPLSFRGRW